MQLTTEENELLRKFFLFAGLSDEAFSRVCSLMERQEFSKGEDIYTRSSFRRSLAVILSGEARVYKGGTLLNILREGSCFGAAALFAPEEEYVTRVEAARDSAVAFIEAERLRELMLSQPDIALKYIEFLSGRIRFLNKKIDAFTSPSALDALWLWLSGRAGRDGRVRVSGGYARLARELNMGRASLYRALKALEEEGCIIKNGPEIKITGHFNKEDII